MKTAGNTVDETVPYEVLKVIGWLTVADFNRDALIGLAFGRSDTANMLDSWGMQRDSAITMDNQVVAGLIIPLLIGIPILLTRYPLYYSARRTRWQFAAWVSWFLSCVGFIVIVFFWATEIRFLAVLTGASSGISFVAAVGVGVLAWWDGRKEDPSAGGRRGV